MRFITTLLTGIVTFLTAVCSAQQLPFTIACLAEDEKPLEVELCRAIFDAADAHEHIRESTPTDKSAVFVIVIPLHKEELTGDAVPVSVAVLYVPSGFNGLAFYIFSACYVAPRSEFGAYAEGIIAQSFVRSAEWLIKAPERIPDVAPVKVDPMTLETNPP